MADDDAEFTVTPDIARAVMAHMNGDHAADNMLICRAFGRDDVIEAELVSVDDRGAAFVAVTPEGTERVDVAWSGPLADRPAIRRQFVRLYEDACARLGVVPRPH